MLAEASEVAKNPKIQEYSKAESTVTVDDVKVCAPYISKKSESTFIALGRYLNLQNLCGEMAQKLKSIPFDSSFQSESAEFF